MARRKDPDFCAEVSREHCGCMLLHTCSTLAADVCEDHVARGGTLQPRLGQCLAAYQARATRESRAALCDALWTDTDENMRAFLREYDRYRSMHSRREMRALLGRLDQLEAAWAATEGNPPRRMSADQ